MTILKRLIYYFELPNHITDNAKDVFYEGKEFGEEEASFIWNRNIELTYKKLRKYRSFDFIVDKNYAPKIKVLSHEELEKMSKQEQLEYEKYLKENTTEEENLKLLLMPVISPIVDKVTKSENRWLTKEEMEQIVKESITALRSSLQHETIDSQKEEFFFVISRHE